MDCRVEPGDIVATGTNHRGLNPFMDGDKIELEIDGIGKLAFNIKDELKRSWERRTRLQMHEQAAQKTAGAYPDITPQKTGKYAPILTKVASLGTGAGMTEKVGRQGYSP